MRAPFPRLLLLALIVAGPVAASARPARAAARIEDVEDALAHDRSYKVRVDAALVLGRLRQSRSIPALIGALRDPNPAVRASIAWALAHRDEIIATLAQEDRGEKSLSNPALIDYYLNLYANHDTAAIADDARRAVDVLFARAKAAGLVSGDVTADWSD